MATVAAPAFPTPRFHIVACRDADVLALTPILRAAPIPREQPGHPSCTYLDRRIRKPWGFEERIYDDAISEAWLLEIRGLRRTSMHAHLRKTTILVPIDGHGYLRTIHGEQIELVPGTAVLIMPGALHCSSTPSGMTVLELECPKDKYDLVRVEDPTRPRGVGYEGADAACEAAPDEDGEPLRPVEGGPPLARLRAGSTAGGLRFELQTGAQLKARPGGLRTAISVETATVLRCEFAVVAPDTVGDAVDADMHLAIRGGAR
jgi:mannose-6-phosphate isomerase-like protein (cupin superfamily)